MRVAESVAEIATLQPAELGRPLTADQLKARLFLIQSVMRDVMQDGTDYGKIPGTDKPTLLKPGAEKLCVTFRLAPDDPIVDQIPELTGDIRYRVRVPVRTHDGALVAVGIGECSTGEEKYRWRRPVHQNEFDNAPEDMRRVKWTRNGDQWRQVRVTPADVANTVLKMAHKRAYVHAVIMATAAGAIFTQDIEDMPEGVEHAEDAPDQRPKTQAPQRKASAPPAGAGTVVTVSVTGTTKKSGTNDHGPWTLYTIFASDGKGYKTFDGQIDKMAIDAKASGAQLRITYTEDRYGRNITGCEHVEREPGSEG